MPSYFVDTIAVAKHCHREAGSGHVDALFSEADTSRFVSRLTAVELHSVLAKKVRTGDILREDFERLRRRFLFDVHQGVLHIIRVTSTHYSLAQKLLVKHGPAKSLRTLDALQLAVAKEVHGQVTLSGFVAADESLLENCRGRRTQTDEP